MNWGSKMGADFNKVAPFTPSPFAGDKFHEECGVFGVFGVEEAAAYTALGLHALQHRGQEGAGIVSTDYTQFYSHRALGLVGDQFNTPKVIKRLKGMAAIGHNRYSTSGEPHIRNVQPFVAELSLGGVALAHNGNLTNAHLLKEALIHKGAIFHTTSDTEVLVHLIAHAKGDAKGDTIAKRITDAMAQVEGAYSLVVLTTDTLTGLRDPNGVRPLVLGKLGEGYVLASESCALDINGAEFVRDIAPGEMVEITKDGIKSSFPLTKSTPHFCVFEFIYFARPDSLVEGKNVYEMRKRIGMELARESHTIQADLVVPVPDSGVPAAIGYANQAGIDFDLGIIRNHYVGRTFIEPTDQVRHLGVKLKHNANRAALMGKSVVLVDDSIVRGTTSKKIVNMVKEAGAREVHMRIASPPTTHSCFYGVDTPSREKLMAATHTLEEMKAAIGVDSLSFVSLKGLYRAISGNEKLEGYCDACFSGQYPIALSDYEAGKTNKNGNLFTV